MAAATTPIFSLQRIAPAQWFLPVAAAQNIPTGVAVCTDAAGNANNASDTAGLVFCGFCGQTANNTGGSAGAISVQVDTLADKEQRFFIANCTGATQAWVGTRVFWIDNQTVAQAGGSTNKVTAGTVKQVLSATQVIVDGCERFVPAAT